MTIGAAIVIPAAIAVGVLVPRDHANEIEVDEVVERFRASTVPDTTEPVPPETGSEVADTTLSTPVQSSETPPPETGSTIPAPQPVALVEPGVYVYDTVGFESIDALSGVTHEYPTETAITVTGAGCGVLLRWDALEERREEWRLCATPDGVVLQPESLQYHEFFDQETPETVLCDVPVLAVPVSGDSFEPVARTCTIEDRPWLPVWEVLEMGVREVDGEPIDVRHVRMTIDDNDDHFEHYVADWWLAPNGLPVELDVVKRSKSPSVVGDVVYDEIIQLQLVSAEPLR